MEENIHVHVEDNSPSIEHILRPITYTSWLLGVGVAHPRKCPKAITIIIRIIHMAVCSYITICDIFYYNSLFNLYKNRSNYIYFLNTIICYISNYYYIYHGFRKYNKWSKLMDRLKELDQKIRKKISMNDRSIKIVEALAVFTTFIFWPLLPIIHILFYLFGFLNARYILAYPEYGTFTLDMLFYYTIAQSLINSFVFDVVVYVLYRRFQTINKLIGQLDELSDVQRIAFKIRHIRGLHADICDLASMVNDIHDLHLLFCSVNCFTIAVPTLFNLYSFMNEFSPIILIQHLLCLVYAMQFCLICWVCTLACQESNRTGRTIHKIILNCNPVTLGKNEASNQSSLEVRSSLEDSNDVQNSNCSSNYNLCVVENFLRRNLVQKCVTKEVYNFSIQLQQNQVSFTACDFFEMNNTSFRCFVGVIVTHLVIFIQFHQQSEDFYNILKKHLLEMCSENVKNMTLDHIIMLLLFLAL